MIVATGLFMNNRNGVLNAFNTGWLNAPVNRILTLLTV